MLGGEVLEMVGRLHIGDDGAGTGRETGGTVLNVVALGRATGSPRNGGLLFVDIADVQVDGVGTFGAGIVDGEEAAGSRGAAATVQGVVVGIADDETADGVVVAGEPLEMQGVLAHFKRVGVGVEGGQ